MKSPMPLRWKLLAGALALSLLAAGWIDAREPGLAEVTQPLVPARAARTAAAGSARPPAPAEIALEKLRRPQAGQSVKDVFAAHSWHVPPPPPPPPPQMQPPLPASAPPLPFVYLGKMVDQGGVTVFVAKQDSNYAVKAGDVLDGSYRVDAIAGSLMTLTYLPLDMKQTMHIGDPN